jgi:phage protein D
MVSSLLPGGSAPPAVRRPEFEVAFGDAGADEWKEALVSVTVEAGVAPFVDVVEIVMSGAAQAPQPAAGDEGTVAFGYEDESTQTVFTGKVESVTNRITGQALVTAANGGGPLSRCRVNRSYEQQTAGAIVTDLAGQAGVGLDKAEDGGTFPFYVVDDRQGAWRHIAALARTCGYLACFTPEGLLRFVPIASSQPVQTFAYGADVIALQLTAAVPAFDKVTAIGEGAAGSQGQEAWNWLVKDAAPVTAEAGAGDFARLLSDPRLRSNDLATMAAKGLMTAASLAKTAGRVLVPGAPAVTVGSAIELTDAPQDCLNGPFLVRRVRHRFSKREGFTSRIDFSRADDGLGLGGL